MILYLSTFLLVSVQPNCKGKALSTCRGYGDVAQPFCCLDEELVCTVADKIMPYNPLTNSTGLCRNCIPLSKAETRRCPNDGPAAPMDIAITRLGFVRPVLK